MTEEKVIRKKIRATGLMAQYMKEYFLELDHCARTGEKKVAWCTSVGPAELLHSLGFVVHYPENHGAMLGTSRIAADLIPYANTLGFSPDICSYLTSDIGSYVTNNTPLTKAYGIEKIPKPDVLVFDTNQCRDVQDWMSWYARELKIPIMGIHAPKYPSEITEIHVESMAKQTEELVKPLEEISGNKFDIDKLREVIKLSRECTELWGKVLKTASASPSPITFFDGTIHMGPAVVLRGTPQAVDYYKVLLTELEERIANGEGALEEEKHRLYWEGMPIWGRLRAHSELFANLKACVLASTYCNSWIFSSFDEKDPFRSMAKAYAEIFIVRSEEYKEKYIKEMIDLYKIDGIIYHDAKTCPANSNCRYGMHLRLEKETGIPSLILNGDLNDMRLVSDEQTKTNIEAFIEQLEEN
ncbi:2-hydroxyacyl-CoA dehydratase [Bacteroidetes/Chlorobi group bacterium ChocPot_Mid]|jgi:benzoyl-CoA reductase/2-hydroxyglutaryl-CoA dehydratase subunit BcrC/BadD/HgdB|nr:MAG: 2-hydroxyacyl-CoA dehydratase [Bacteroidetes/Chlorobi group bacterium ChocPot_Mid]